MEIKLIMEDANWDLIPEHMQGAMKRYLFQGLQPGSFLEAVLTNNLSEAFRRADDININRIADYVRFLTWHAPAACWGSEEAYSRWVECGGFMGIMEKETKDV